MKITNIRTRAIEWRGKTVPLPPHFCTNPMDLVQEQASAGKQAGSMSTFTFHGWLLVEIETDAGIVGIGEGVMREDGRVGTRNVLLVLQAMDSAGKGYWKCDGAQAGRDVVGYRPHIMTCSHWCELLFGAARG